MKQLRKRMVGYFVLVNTILSIALLVSFVFLAHRQFTNQQEDMIQGQMQVLVDSIDRDPAAKESVESLQDQVEAVSDYFSERISLMDADGQVLFDTEVDEDRVENHANREEFMEAVESGQIETASRQSMSTDQSMYYAAQAIRDQSGNLLGVVRISNTVDNLNQVVVFLSSLLAISLLILILITIFMTFYWTNKIGKPIDEIKSVTHELANKNYDARYTLSSYSDINELGDSINDLAENLKAQFNAIKHNDQQLTKLLENLVVGVILINENREITVCNPMANEILGVNIYGNIGRVYSDIIHSSDIIQLVEKAIRKNRAQNKEIILYLQNEKTLDVNVVPIREEEEKNDYVLLFYDITEIKRLEQVRTDFVANASHELRTPITALKGFSETLLDGAMEDRDLLVEFLEIMLKESTRLDSMVQDILQLSRLEQRPSQQGVSPVAVDQVIADVMQVLQQKAESKQISLNLHVKDKVQVLVNQDELKQVAMNLIGNAITYTPEQGHVETEIYQENNEAVIKIADDGIGIPEKDQARIFERFYRVDKARSRNAGGTGLGLSIVKWLVEGMEGRIQVESQLGQGSAFYLYLPLYQDEKDPDMSGIKLS